MQHTAAHPTELRSRRAQSPLLLFPPLKKGGQGGFAFASPKAKANPPRYSHRFDFVVAPGAAPFFKGGDLTRLFLIFG
ncbi:MULTISPECIES: hypothetical protein [Lysobacter]|uniref:hypothetical protein n=1 Tax=Lysobacter TaxID=68 RepID=UPI001F341B8C|nr:MULTISPECIES: hypothetical protein [Lysobacter]UJB19081.1 hypothetical protein L1A79_22665 [Lysobacter capsici]UJQ27194.1 hypothetical protein L2D09_17220 [Lysobacter gummosus]